MDTIAFSETSLCRRKYLLHYFGEEFNAEQCNEMCDNCKNPKEKIEGEKYVKLLLESILGCKERFKPKEMAKMMIGEKNSLIQQHMSQIEDFFGTGKDQLALQSKCSVLRLTIKSN